MSKGVKERIAEFCKYHRDGDGECNSIVLKQWADRRKLNLKQRWELAYMFAVTYSVPSAIVLFENPESWDNAEAIKDKLVFQSDRKYVRMLNNFQNSLTFYKKKLQDVGSFLLRNSKGGTLNLEKAIGEVEHWYFFGRFSAFLFLEMFVWLTDIPATNTTIDWKNGATATSGLLNIYGYDDFATAFDKNGKLCLSKNQMDGLLGNLIKEIANTGGNTNVTVIETSLCAYRKHYKGSRYNGYYLDRMLEEIHFIKKEFPSIAKELFEIRAGKFDKKYLGEFGGWTAIQREKKKHYQRTGEML